MYNRRYPIGVVIYILVFVLTNLLRLLPQDDAGYRLISIIQYFLFTALVIFWAASSGTRLRHPQIRVYHGMLVALICMKLLFRSTRHIIYAGILPYERILWYCYYIPDLLVPYISWLMTRYVGQPEGWRIPRVSFSPLLIYLVLAAGIVTNEYHGLAFEIDTQAPYHLITRAYRVSYLYYAAQVFMFVFAILAVARLHRVCREEGLRSHSWLPAAIILTGILYTVLYSANLVPVINESVVIEASAMSFLTTIATWEACLLTGLIPNNRGYDALFAASTVPMRITDQEQRVRFQTRTFAAERREDTREYLTRTYEIPGGTVRFDEDVTDMMQSMRRTKALAGELEEANRQLAAQTQIKRQTIRANERSRLYTKALGVVKNQEEELLRLIGDCHTLRDEALQNTLSLAAVYAAYIKRRSNLVLIAQQKEVLPVQELHFCLKETVEALALMRVGTTYRQEMDPERLMKPEGIMRIYDAVQEALEAVLPGLTQIAILLKADEEDVTLEMTLEGGAFGKKTMRWQE